MASSAAYCIQTLSYSSTRLVWRGNVKVAILFSPLEEGAPYHLYPHPATFPSLDFKGLPEPLRPEFMAFPDIEAVEAFLGIASQEDEPASMTAAA